MNLQGRTALVTGAGRGIGAAIAAELASCGASVVLADLDPDAAAKAVAGIRASGGIARGVTMDVADADSVARAVSDAAGAGCIDVLVNNAGVDVIGPFVASSAETWDWLISVNLKGPIQCARSVLEPMLAQGFGRIINIASDAGRIGSSGEVVYSATKGGVIAFTKALARETAAQGVTVNCVCPGPTDTALLGQVAAASQRLYDGLSRSVPMRRIGTPADVAPAVAFLAGPGARYITGQTLSVSGGLTML